MGAKHLANITLRLTEQERELLKILNAALKVSEYTDEVENERSMYRREGVMKNGMADLFTTLTGLSVISNELPPKVREAIKSKDVKFDSVAPVVQRFFEIGRRFKRMNPDKMRSEYGKLVMLLQDAANPNLRKILNFNPLIPIRTVGDGLKEINAIDMLKDPRINTAVGLLPTGYTKKHLELKNKSIEELLEKYGGGPRDSGDAQIESRRKHAELCLLSIGDAIALIETNRALVRKVITWLEKYFGNQTQPSNKKFDLSIRSGSGGAKLTHTHRQQFLYVKEALTLWDIVQREIFNFWENVENDMLVNNTNYRNMNTGQGVHRVSAGPSTAGLMHGCVAEADKAMGGWVGIKVVHMGDQDVPNPLVFIDKYTIIPRLLGPIVHTIEELEIEFGLGSTRDHPDRFTDAVVGDHDNDDDSTAVGEDDDKSREKSPSRNNDNKKKLVSDSQDDDEATKKVSTRGEKYPGYRDLLLTGFESGEDLIIEVLRDFFRHGFNGDGDDGGACIDGRLTSAWNWCSELHKKKYYQAFLLTGFVGFDANYN